LLPAGYNYFGQLGLGDREDRWVVVRGRSCVDCALLGDLCGRDGCWRLPHAPSHALTSSCLLFGCRLSLRPVKCLRDPVALVAGEHNSGCINGDGTIHFFGRNDHGQLGLGDDRSRVSGLLSSSACCPARPAPEHPVACCAGAAAEQALPSSAVAHSAAINRAAAGADAAAWLQSRAPRQDAAQEQEVGCWGGRSSSRVASDGDALQLLPFFLMTRPPRRPTSDRLPVWRCRSAPRMRRRLEDTDQQLQAKSASPEAECQAKVATRGATPPQQQPAQQQIIPVPAA